MTAQLLEFMAHHTASIVTEAAQNRVYREQGKNVSNQDPSVAPQQLMITTPINSDDIKLAMKFKDLKNTHMPSHTIQNYAAEKNRTPLHQLVLGGQIFSNQDQKKVDEIHDQAQRR